MTKSWLTGISLLLMAAGLHGCSSSPPVRYFSLEPVYETVANSAAEQPIVGLGQLRTPNYLFRSQMVTRSRGGEIVVHDYRRWSEPLDQAIHRVVAANVDSLVANMTVISFPYQNSVRPSYRVHGSVDRLDVDDSGLAVLAVQWGITSRDGTVVTAPRRGRYESRTDSPDDPAAVVDALNQALAGFSREIASSLDAL